MAQNGEGRVAGKVALITGAGSGLGRASAIMLAAEGARVAVTDIDGAAAQVVAREIGGNAVAFEHDVTDEARWREVLDAVAQALGGLHVLVNNAGIGNGGSVEDVSLEDWRRVHAVNLDGTFLGCKYALAPIRASGGGSVINISSISGIIAGHNLAAYNSSKAAVRHLTKSVALHAARQGYNIRCNSVHPAFIDTPILDGMAPHLGREDLIAKLGRQIPLGRIGQPRDVAHAVLYLASDESAFMTGAEIVIDGGISAM